MNHDYESTEFSRSVLAGVFAGLGATVVVLILNFIFRGMTGFPLSEIINVSTIIFMTMILMTVEGVMFYIFHHYVKAGTMLFRILAVVITAILVFFSLGVERSVNPVFTREFREFLIGIIVIYGLFIAFIIPMLYKSERI